MPTCPFNHRYLEISQAAKVLNPCVSHTTNATSSCPQKHRHVHSYHHCPPVHLFTSFLSPHPVLPGSTTQCRHLPRSLKTSCDPSSLSLRPPLIPSDPQSVFWSHQPFRYRKALFLPDQLQPVLLQRAS